MSASAAAVAPQTGSSRRARAVAVMFSFDQHGPDDARGLGGERHHGDLVTDPLMMKKMSTPRRAVFPIYSGRCGIDALAPCLEGVEKDDE